MKKGDKVTIPGKYWNLGVIKKVKKGLAVVYHEKGGFGATYKLSELRPYVDYGMTAVGALR